MGKSLAVKYRPKTWDDVTEQNSVCTILNNQIDTGTIRNGYLFCGGAGTGKTTCARIFANQINKGKGEPIELDAASNNSVEDIRKVIEQAQTQSLDSEYKVFIIDECFPGNTLVSTESGYVRIKDVEPGIKVKSMTGMQTVTHSFKNSVLTEHLCCVTLNSSKKIITTQDHLFFTNNGWVKVKNLIKGDIVYGTADLQELWKTIQWKGGTELYSEILLPRMFSEIQGENSQAENKNPVLSNLWKGNDCSELFSQKNLFRRVQSENDFQVWKTDYEYRIWDETTETIIRKDVEIKSFSQSRGNSEIESYERKEWNTSYMERRTGWQREVHHTTDSLVRSIREWMGFGISDTNEVQSETRQRNVSYLLQSRPRLSTNESCDRGGWSRPQIEKYCIDRCKESSVVGNIRVESVEVYKRGYNDELFLDSFTSEELSNDYVNMYDLEVENDHCYFVEDVLVHNCHSLSNQAWQAMLKTLEEPPAKSVFIFCTTNPEKIPATILSRVQRFNFQRISQDGIIKRLIYILDEEINSGRNITYELAAVELIAKIADGGMRDAITLADKCLSYSLELNTNTVINALGIADYDTMIKLTDAVLGNNVHDVIDILNGVHKTGIDLRQFIKNYFEYILDVNILHITENPDDTKLPDNVAKLELSKDFSVSLSLAYSALLNFLVELQPKIKWEQNVKAVTIAEFMVFMDNYFKGSNNK